MHPRRNVVFAVPLKHFLGLEPGGLDPQGEGVVGNPGQRSPPEQLEPFRQQLRQASRVLAPPRPRS